jgi:23S rRNA (cytidine1920-2'-O)/16S rRNA (cytidine1409-2'-O)-methyltransferase
VRARQDPPAVHHQRHQVKARKDRLIRRSGKARRARLDAELVARGLAENRSRAQGLILAGRVLLSGGVVSKCGAPVRDGDPIVVLPPPRAFVSRGGEKLDAAMDELGVSCRGVTALDIGASTGGFTDCLLSRGAAKVYAVDVGKGLLDDGLRRDPRVVALEKVNFRFAPAGLIPEKVGAAVIDVSFISLRHILPPLRRFLASGASVLALVKPQFEVGKGRVGKGGIVREEGMRREAVRSVAESAEKLGFIVKGEAESVLPGQRGNREIFLLLEWAGTGAPHAE